MIEWNRRGTIVAMSALVVALLVFGAALARALTLEPVLPRAPVQTPSEPPGAGEPTAGPLVPSEAKLSAGDIALAVDHDPFQPDRTRPAPYRLPGEDVPVVASAPEMPPAPEFLVTGVVQDGEGGIALIQLPDQTSQVIGIGESVLGYRLERVGATSATMVGNGRTLQLELTSAAAQSGDSRNSRSTQSQAEALREALQRRGLPALLQAQRSGMSQEQIQELMQQMGGRGRGGRGTIRRDTSNAPLWQPDGR
ncbi:MAG: hypothetical protein PVH00_06485 [Gemmatimonadota bacterium]|jgi:hypothetical protein